ncbi:hypothetical protein DFJ74DRAFT_610771, partial [Hyaloraphidium curvatum]
RLEVENSVDFDGPPAGFRYTIESVYSDVSKPDADALVACSCEVSCVDSTTCECAQYDDGKTHRAYDSRGRAVDPDFRVIKECNQLCGCGKDCRNRVVQNGRQIPMQIFKTKNRGWGVRPLVPIESRTFVAEYVGTVTRIEDVMALEEDRSVDQRRKEYFFDLDLADSDRDGGETKFSIDAFKYGNVTRFFNHSCRPNLDTYSVFIDSQDGQLYRIAFFTNRDIAAGEELTFDYQPGQEEREEGKKTGATKGQRKRKRGAGPGQGLASPRRRNKLRCYCNSDNCRGTVWTQEGDN